MYKNLILLIITLITACGGDGDSSRSFTSNNPLLKYSGVYYYCGNNEKTSLSLHPNDSNSLNAILSTDIFSDDNCSGIVIGSYQWNTPAVITYKSKTNAKMPMITLLPFSDVVDEVIISVANVTAQLTGSNAKEIASTIHIKLKMVQQLENPVLNLHFRISQKQVHFT